MRKYIIGGLVGATLMLSFNVSAAVESLIGKEVQGEVGVKLNGAALNDKAAVVDGASYLPVRAIAESIGLNVDFQNNEVLLSQKLSEVKAEVTATENTTPTTSKKPLTVEQLDDKIEMAKINIQGLKMGIENGVATDPRYKEYQTRLTKYEAELADFEKQKAELQK